MVCARSIGSFCVNSKGEVGYKSSAGRRAMGMCPVPGASYRITTQQDLFAGTGENHPTC